MTWRRWEVCIYFAGFLGFIIGYKWLFLFTCFAMYSAKSVAMLKHLICLLLSFCMDCVPQTKALCHSVLAAKCNIFFIKFTFLISLMCSITNYSWVLEDTYTWKCVVCHLVLLFLYLFVFGAKHICWIETHSLDDCLVSKIRMMLNNSSCCLAIESLILVFLHLSFCKAEPWHHHSLCSGQW